MGKIRAMWMTRWKGRGFALSLVALLLQVLVPSGYMVQSGSQGPALVICTGHGPLRATDLRHPAKAPPTRPDAPCVFAGHGVLATPATAFVLPATAISYDAAPERQLQDLGPGRGLAAPPPPAQGPPTEI